MLRVPLFFRSGHDCTETETTASNLSCGTNLQHDSLHYEANHRHPMHRSNFSFAKLVGFKHSAFLITSTKPKHRPR